jgi:hypothetical protein
MSDSPVKMMLDVAFGRHQPGTKASGPDTAILLAVADAAAVWWKAHKPADWSLEQHLADPTINCDGDGERQLAQAAAKWVALKK